VLAPGEDRVEKSRTGGIHCAFHYRQPGPGAAILLARLETIAWPDEAVVHRERRLAVGRTHIGKDDAAVFMGGVGPVVQPVFQGTVCRLRWRLPEGPAPPER